MPCALAGGTAGAFYWGLHQNARTASVSEMPLFAVPEKGRRYLILAPHCDDETLAVGGFIADATRKGATVSVAFLTNGDGFPAAATRDLQEVTVSPTDYVRFAEHRQAESSRAAQTLGVAKGNVYFLGYPDRGLRPMWEKYWNTPYRSYYTGHTHSPYPVSYTQHAKYSGQSLENDLVRLMDTVKPTDIFVTHPGDDHPDHSAAASFEQIALLQCQKENKPWAHTAQTHYYIVHRGDWPLPQGKYPAANLTPPVGVVSTDTKWRVYMLSSEAEAAKAKALSRYVSQLNICRRFLTSFVRTNEVFGEMNAPVLPQSVDADVWTTVAAGGKRDDVVRYIDQSADIMAVAVQRREGNRLAVRVRLRGTVDETRLRYTLQIRDSDTVQIVPLFVPEGNESNEPAHELVATITLAPTATGCLWLATETRYRGTAKLPVRPIDRLGYNPLVWGTHLYVSPSAQAGIPKTRAR